jgi:hypothetical protein
MAIFLALLAVAAALFWWMRHRAARLRRDAESREAKMLEALFAARRADGGNGGETIDVDEIFDGQARSPGQSATDAALRAAGLEAAVIALVNSPPARPVAAAAGNEASAPSPSLPQWRHGAKALDEDEAELPASARASEADDQAPVPVRDLVQTFYEARGYRAEPAAPTARPIELVLRHKSDPARTYAFAPLQDPVSEATARSMLECARRVEQPRVLIATESDTDHALAHALQSTGVRVYDRPMIEFQLGRVESATVAKIRAVARRRAARRRPALG